VGAKEKNSSIGYYAGREAEPAPNREEKKRVERGGQISLPRINKGKRTAVLNDRYAQKANLKEGRIERTAIAVRNGKRD